MTTEMMVQPPCDPRDRDWIIAFGMALLQYFESELSGDAVITIQEFARAQLQSAQLSGDAVITFQDGRQSFVECR